jgi:hypothetical protein
VIIKVVRFASSVSVIVHTILKFLIPERKLVHLYFVINFIY